MLFLTRPVCAVHAAAQVALRRLPQHCTLPAARLVVLCTLPGRCIQFPDPAVFSSICFQVGKMHFGYILGWMVVGSGLLWCALVPSLQVAAAAASSAVGLSLAVHSPLLLLLMSLPLLPQVCVELPNIHSHLRGTLLAAPAGLC